MATAKERLAILENIIARVGIDGNVTGEFAKAMSQLNGLQTYTELNPPQMPQGTISSPMGGNTPQPTNEPNPMQNEGQGSLMLP